jgi:hypothetical protein
MSIIKRLEDAAIYGAQPCPVANEAAELLKEIQAYLIAASDGTMSRNNSENLASELLEKIEN